MNENELWWKNFYTSEDSNIIAEIDKNLVECLCNSCGGTGVNIRVVFVDTNLSGRYRTEVVCETCNGHGKINWIQNVFQR